MKFQFGPRAHRTRAVGPGLPRKGAPEQQSRPRHAAVVSREARLVRRKIVEGPAGGVDGTELRLYKGGGALRLGLPLGTPRKSIGATMVGGHQLEPAACRFLGTED